MNVGVVTLYTPDISAYADASTDAMRQYCVRHGYTFICYTKKLWLERPPPYSKLFALRQHLDNFDWLLWLDADVAIVRPEQRADTIIDERYHLLLGNDSYGFNTGVLFLRNSAEGREILQATIEYPAWNPNVCWEQDSFKALLDQHAKFRSWTLMLGDRYNTHWSYRHPRWLFHVYGESLGFRKRLIPGLLKHYAKIHAGHEPAP